MASLRPTEENVYLLASVFCRVVICVVFAWLVYKSSDSNWSIFTFDLVTTFLESLFLTFNCRTNNISNIRAEFLKYLTDG